LGEEENQNNNQGEDNTSGLRGTSDKIKGYNDLSRALTSTAG